jgi:hypothetical protein
MDARYRNLAVLVVVVVFAAAVYFLVSSPAVLPGPGKTEKTFSQEYSDLALSWKSEGFNEPSLQANFGALVEMPAGKLEAIKSSLESTSAAQKGPAVKALANVYVLLVDVAEKAGEIDRLNGAIDSSAPVCENVSLFKSINLKKQALADTANAFDAALASFAEKYPSQAEEINLNRLGVSFEGLRAQVEGDNVMIALLETEC